MEKPNQKYQEFVDPGTSLLVEAFGAAIEELFKKPLIVMKENDNPFSELPQHIQIAIIQNAFHRGLGQSLASMAMLAGGDVTDKEVFSSGTVVLKHYFYFYLSQFRRRSAAHKTTLDQGHSSGDELPGPVLSDEPDTEVHEGGIAVHSHEHNGHVGESGS